jgi:2-polyprenyl-3-methyl-5-hydroxy-6-metoxy-1,4-benzoquinol methylase
VKIDAAFYQERLNKCKNDPQRAVWEGSQEDYARVKKESIEICREYVKPGMRVLDAGCGIGELTECLPGGIEYLGIDFCEGFVEVARKRYPNYKFEVCNLLDLSRFTDDSFHLAICRTVEGVVSGQEPNAWDKIIAGLSRIAVILLIFRARQEVGDTLKTVEVLS